MGGRLETAIKLARRAGGLLHEGYRQPKRIERKGTIDLVTEYDLKSEELLVNGILSAYPHDSILAEEGGRAGGTPPGAEKDASPTSVELPVPSEGEGPVPPAPSGREGRPGKGDSYLWLVDPLDGTTNFAHGLPFFSVAIALMSAEEIIFGVVYDPERDELFQATRGEGALLNGERVRVSDTETVTDSLLVTGFPYDVRTNPNNNINHYSTLALRSRGVRRLGSAALDLAYVAAGRLDGYWELRLNPWDWAAGVLMVREAGGQVTTMTGGQKVLAGDETLLATNGLIHERMIEALQQR
jgi:myo-inositol-1(or 4)-monophosphatase